MKRSLKPQVRTHLKVKAALLNLPLSHFVWWAEQSVVRATQPHRSGPRAPRKRSRSSWNVTNWSFKFYIFPEKKKKKKKEAAWGVRWGYTQNFSSGRGVSGMAPFWSGFPPKAWFRGGRGATDTCGPAWGAAPDFRPAREAVCSLFSLCMKLMGFAVD